MGKSNSSQSRSSLSVPKTKKDKTSKKNVGKEKISQTGTAESNPEPKDSVRGVIAPFYVKAYICIIAGSLLLLVLCGYTINAIKDVLLAISGVLSGPLGFIIGFYFKEELKNK